MDESLRSEAKQLREMSSREAADYLIATYPAGSDNAGRAIQLLVHRSWLVVEQYQLARTYLVNLPHANDAAYKAFFSLMSVSNFVAVLREQLPSIRVGGGDLLRYYLTPLLDSCARPSDRHALETFLEDTKRVAPA